MRKTVYSIFVLMTILAVSCVKSGIPGEDSVSGIRLTVATGEVEPGLKASTMPSPRNGDDHENLLNSFYYYFYPKGNTASEPAVSGFVAGISTTGEATTTVPVSAETISNVLFRSDNSCQLFIVANPPSDLVASLTASSGCSLAALRSKVIMSSLNGTQENFVMVYDGLVAVSSLSQKTAIDVSVGLDRLASKFTLGAYVSPEITDPVDPTMTYVPGSDGLKVTFCNALNRTTLGGFDKAVLQEGDFFNSDALDLGTPTDEELDAVTYKYFHSDVPAYTYPMEWSFTSKNEPYLLYEMHWDVKKDGSTLAYNKPLYYKLTLGNREIGSNYWYDVAAKLTILGSLYPEDPTEIFSNMTYEVLDWVDAYEGDAAPNTSAEIKDTRYLAVPQTEWTLNNKEEVVIPFSSSHPCEVENLNMSTISYSSGDADSKDPHFTEVDCDLNQPNQVTVTHKLYNTLGAGMDCAPITISFDLQHTDNPAFVEHITITQNPAITIETIANSAGTANKGYTYVNNSQTDDWQTVSGVATSGSDNRSHYFTVITVSQFDPITGFIVGDPRNSVVDNLDINTSSVGVQWNIHNPVSVPAKYSRDGQTGNRTIKYYHPTIDDGTRDNFVAPSIRVNSAHCRSGRNETYQNAVQRCAAYQEDGYPAGRWRLPTLAECKLIQTMSRTGIVPTIFINGSGRYYCYAGGWFPGNASSDSDYHPYSSGYSKTTDTGGSGGGAARCVYDEWYWSQIDAEFGWDNSDKTTFKWGDIPDNYTHPTH